MAQALEVRAGLRLYALPCEHAFMQFSALWQTLTLETREWLMDHNGEALSDAVLENIVAANGGSADPTWYAEDADGNPRLSDSIVDWIETVANDEEPLGKA